MLDCQGINVIIRLRELSNVITNVVSRGMILNKLTSTTHGYFKKYELEGK